MHTSAVMGPIYFRSTVPTGVTSFRNIGSTTAWGINSNFDMFPGEYLVYPNYIDENLMLLSPREIKNLAGNILLVRDDILSVGGFNGDGAIELNYGGETNLAIKLSELRSPGIIPMVFCPSPALATVHLRYGYHREKNKGDLTYADNYGVSSEELAKMIEISNRPNFDSGNRRESGFI